MAGDAHELYGLLGGRFEQLVRREVRAPAPVTENACRSAVGRLVYHAQRVEQDTLLSWLMRSAVHEAFKPIQPRAARAVARGAVRGDGEVMLPARIPAPEEQQSCASSSHRSAGCPQASRDFCGLQAARLSHQEIVRGARIDPAHGRAADPAEKGTGVRLRERPRECRDGRGAAVQSAADGVLLAGRAKAS